MPQYLAYLVVFLLPALAASADKPAVVEMFEDDTDALIPQLTMGGIDGSENVPVSSEKRSVFTGRAARRVAPAQRFSPDI